MGAFKRTWKNSRRPRFRYRHGFNGRVWGWPWRMDMDLRLAPLRQGLKQAGRESLESLEISCCCFHLGVLLFPKQFTVGVLNSILKCVRLVSGAVSASGRFVFKFICLPIHLSPRSCVKGCVHLPGLCVPSVPKQFTVGVLNSLSSGVRLCSDGGVLLSGCPEFICLPLWQFICLPVWLVVSGSSAVSVTLVMSGSLAVSNSFVSKSGWWRLCLPNDSFVSQSGWWCPAFRLAPIHLSPLVTLHLSPSLAGGVWLSGCLQFICIRLVAIHLSPSLAGGVRLSMLSAVSNSFVFPCSNSFVSQSGWWCPALAVSN